MQTIGQVVPCAHCGSRGSCSCYDCRQVVGAGEGKAVKCSACGGKGSLWIGPDTVNVYYYNSPK